MEILPIIAIFFAIIHGILLCFVSDVAPVSGIPMIFLRLLFAVEMSMIVAVGLLIAVMMAGGVFVFGGA